MATSSDQARRTRRRTGRTRTDDRYATARSAVPSSRAHVAIGFHAPGILSERRPGAGSSCGDTGDGRASLLNQYVRDEKGLITSGSASHQAFRDLGFFEIDFETSKPLEAQIGVLAELENIKKYGVTNEALARAKALIAQAHYHQLETVDGVPRILRYYEALGDWKKSDGYIAAIQKVTPADVLRVAKKYLTFGESQRLRVPAGIRDANARTSTIIVSWFLQRFRRRRKSDPIVELPVTAEIPSDTRRRTARSRQTDSETVDSPRSRCLHSGRPSAAARFVRNFLSRRPALRVRRRTAGITELMLRTAIRGTKRFNSADISRRLENAGARIQVVNEPDFFGYILDGLSGKMDQASRS